MGNQVRTYLARVQTPHVNGYGHSKTVFSSSFRRCHLGLRHQSRPRHVVGTARTIWNAYFLLRAAPFHCRYMTRSTAKPPAAPKAAPRRRRQQAKPKRRSQPRVLRPPAMESRGGIRFRWIDSKHPAPTAPTYQYSHDLPLMAYNAVSRLEGSMDGGNDTTSGSFASGGTSNGSAFLFMPSLHSTVQLMTINMRDPTVLGDVPTDADVPNETVRSGTVRAPYVVGPNQRQRLVEGTMRVSMSGADLVTGWVTVFRISREALINDLQTYTASIMADRDIIYRFPVKELANKALELKAPVTNPAALPRFQTPVQQVTVGTTLDEDNPLDGVCVCITDFDIASTIAHPSFVFESFSHVEMLINPSSTYPRTNNPRRNIKDAEHPNFRAPRQVNNRTGATVIYG